MASKVVIDIARDYQFLATEVVDPELKVEHIVELLRLAYTQTYKYIDDEVSNDTTS